MVAPLLPIPPRPDAAVKAAQRTLDDAIQALERAKRAHNPLQLENAIWSAYSFIEAAERAYLQEAGKTLLGDTKVDAKYISKSEGGTRNE